MINESPVITTFSGIVDGYRASYTPTTISGGMLVTVHAENVVSGTCSGIVETDYTILFGYNILFDEYLDWGVGNDVIIWSSASNEVFCPNSEAYATYFQTRDFVYTDLGATILPRGFANLAAEIYPQSKHFFYNGIYRITISGVKDFSGNILEPFSFEFTIEGG